MSQQITTAMVKQYSSNVLHLVQQKGSRLTSRVRNESLSAEESFYDRLGAVEAQRKTGRHSDIVFNETPHSRRKITPMDFYYADLVDKEDKLRLIISPESEYAIAAKNALGRSTDDVIIAGLLGTAYGGKEGKIPIDLPDTQKVIAFSTKGTPPTTGSGLNVETLRAVKKKFNANEAEGDLTFLVSAEQLDNLLAETEIQSYDYNAVKALVQGDVDTYMSFKFIRTERLPVTQADVTYNVANGKVDSGGTGTLTKGARRCVAFQTAGIILATSRNVFSRIDERVDKHFSHQVYAAMTIGSTRIEDERVVEVLCLE